ncbi:hypothetical protein X777_09422 [Ooceraea biroi]|uniref:Endonuclease/exonuclease/phosphatase domain-containing protein n=1 Tax=Ooceraea biroi TaxID=2015173 RepID=A0A026X1B3_OOCBI|nr:hypothetical protein X777_09422 [Ooceraea biroi]
MWNCFNTDENGIRLYDGMFRNDYLCMNSGTLSRLNYANQRPSNIDLVFASSNIADTVTCSQHTDTWGSDHFPIVVDIESDTEIYNKKINRLSTKKTDWKLFQRTLHEDLEQQETVLKGIPPLESYDQFYQIVVRAMDRASGRSTGSSTKAIEDTLFIESARCECGYAVEDINHVIWRCSRYDNERDILYRELRKKDVYGAEDMNAILKRQDICKLEVIFNFVKKIQRII